MRGVVREGWVEVGLGEVGNWSSGGTPSKARPDFWGPGIPWVSPKDMKSFRITASEDQITEAALHQTSMRLIPKGSVLLVVRSGILARTLPVGITSAPVTINQDLKAILPHDGVDPAFLGWFLRSAENRILRDCAKSGTTVSSIKTAALESVRIPLAPVPEQRRIVAKIEELFSELDAGVAALERAQVKLERYRASVLKAAVEGRLTEEWRKENPPEETGEELLKRILTERRKRWEEEQLATFEAKGKKPPAGWREKYKEPEGPDTSGLPELPEGWCWGTLGQAFRVFVGATPSRAVPAFWNGSIPWVSSGEIAFQDIVRTREGVSQSGLDSSSTTVHPPGTVMLAMIGEGRTRGQSAILRIHACNNQNSAAIRVSETPCDPSWVFRFLQSRYEETRGIGSGNNQPALNKAKVKSIPIPLPPLTEQWLIGNRIAELSAVIHEMDGRIRSAKKMSSTLRQSILKLAFEGRLVPQDPNDEPASVLLERIRASRKAEKPGAKRPRKRKSSQGSLDL